MSKVDAQRAMREARFALLTAQAAANAATGAKPGRPASTRTSPGPTEARPVAEAAAEPGPVDVAVSESGLCGHRSIGNKSCRRPSGHSEKNHRYT